LNSHVIPLPIVASFVTIVQWSSVKPEQLSAQMAPAVEAELSEKMVFDISQSDNEL